MKTVNLRGAKANLLKLIAEAEAGAGEVFVIKPGTKPVVRLVAIGEDAQRPRVFGTLAGRVQVSDAFDEELSESERLVHQRDRPLVGEDRPRCEGPRQGGHPS